MSDFTPNFDPDRRWFLRLEDIDFGGYSGNVGTRTQRCLANANLLHLLDLLAMKEAQLMELDNFGRKCLNAIKDALNPMGVYLGQFSPNVAVDLANAVCGSRDSPVLTAEEKIHWLNPASWEALDAELKKNFLKGGHPTLPLCPPALQPFIQPAPEAPMTTFNPDRRWLLPLDRVSLGDTKRSSTSIRRLLNLDGIHTMLDLVACDEERLSKINGGGFGKKTRDALKNTLREKYGLTLAMVQPEAVKDIEQELDPNGDGLSSDEIAHWLHRSWPEGGPKRPIPGNRLLALLNEEQIASLNTEAKIDIAPVVVDAIRKGVLEMNESAVKATNMKSLHAVFATLRGRQEAPNALIVVQRHDVAPPDIVALLTFEAPGLHLDFETRNVPRSTLIETLDAVTKKQGCVSVIPSYPLMTIITCSSLLQQIPRPKPAITLVGAATASTAQPA